MRDLALGEQLLRRGSLAVGVALAHGVRGHRLQQRLTLAHLQDALAQVFGRRVLEQETLRTGFDRFEQHRAVVEGSEQDHRACGRRAPAARAALRCRTARACARPRRSRPPVSCASLSTSSRPSAASTAISMSRPRSTQLEALAHQGLIVGERDAGDGHQWQRHRDVQRHACAAGREISSAAGHERQPFAHALEAESFAQRQFAAAVVADRQPAPRRPSRSSAIQALAACACRTMLVSASCTTRSSVSACATLSTRASASTVR